MPLIIGDLKATIHVRASSERDSSAPTEAGRFGAGEEAEPARRLAALRFESERKVLQRDPDILGGQ